MKQIIGLFLWLAVIVEAFFAGVCTGVQCAIVGDYRNQPVFYLIAFLVMVAATGIATWAMNNPPAVLRWQSYCLAEEQRRHGKRNG